MSNSEYTTIFAGNPGSGKSTLLNSLAGIIHFQSGVSIGQGCTTVVQTKLGNDGKMYGDTPGLDDITIRERAANQINIILRENNAIKLCFVITLEAGRVKPSDIATMEVILNALPPSANMFSVIVNKLEKSVFRKLQDPDNVTILLAGLFSGKHCTSHVYLVQKESDADGEDNVMISNIQPLKTSLESAPIFRYNSADVKDIKHDAFEEMREKFAADLEAIRNANKEQIEQITRQHNEALAQAREDARIERDRFAKQMDKMNEQHRLDLAALNERVKAADRSDDLLQVIKTVARGAAAALTGGASETVIVPLKILGSAIENSAKRTRRV